MKKKHIGLLIIFLLSILINPVSAYSKTAPYAEIETGSSPNWPLEWLGLTDAEFIQAGHNERIRQNGTIYQLKFDVANASQLEAFHFTIWRKNENGNYNRIAITDNLVNITTFSDGINQIDIVPIEGVQEGDYYGYYIRTTGNALHINEEPTEPQLTYYVNGSVNSTSNYIWNQSNYRPFIFVIETYMENPYMVFIGDSIISGLNDHYSFIEYVDITNISTTIENQWSKKVDKTYQNMGYNAHRTNSINARFESDVIDLSSEFVLIEGGVNDVNCHHFTENHICNNYESMIIAAINNDITPVIMLILPENDHGNYGTHQDMETIDSINEKLIEIAAENPPTIVVDARSYVGTSRPGYPPENLWNINPDYDSGDGIHFNAEGHERIAQAIKDSFIYLYREPGLYNVVQSDGTVIYSKNLVSADNTSCRMSSMSNAANVSFNEPSSDKLMDFTINSGSIDSISIDNLPSDYVCNLRHSDNTLIENRTVQNGIVYFTEDISPGSYYVDYEISDTTPPASITQLHNTTYEQTYIDWTWTDPIDSDFSHVMVYLNGIFMTNVSSGIQFYNATGLNSSTEYQISTHTVDTARIINETWVNSTARTNQLIDTTPPIIITATANPYTIEANGTENTILNVTAYDISGIASVTINLSSLNGSPYQEMENNNGIWQYTITTTFIDEFNLPINVTDNANISNTSVNISLCANDSVSPVISNPVDKPIEQCIDQCTPEYITWKIIEIHPGMYRVLRNGTQVVSPTLYNSGVNFTLSIDTSISGIWNYTIIANDASGNTASDQVNITVRDTTDPIITGPEDHLIEQNATGNITWNIIDANPGEYRILKNGTQIDNATFISGDDITKEINSTTLGIWNYTIIANDTSGNISSDQVNITVRETIPPVIYSPPDQTIERTDIGEISWRITDTTPNKYQVLRNGTQVEPPTSYSSDEVITIPLNTTTVGKWNYTIIANDTSGSITSNKVNITIVDKRKISICITSPGHESDTTSMTIFVKGTVDGNGSYPTVLVNGKVAVLNLTGYIGTFCASGIPLTDGTNEITAKVTNEMDEEKLYYIKVIRRIETPRSSGGRSSGGSSSSEDHTNIFFSETKREFITKDEIICYHFESESNIVEYINFTSKKTAGKVPARIEILNHTSSLVNYAPVDTVYKNLNIWVGNLGWAIEKNIDNVSVSFKLERSWITHNNIDITTIEMNRYNSGKWNPLTTSLIRQDDTYMYFEAKTPGFSPFVITGKQGYIGNSNKPGDEGITVTPTDITDTTNEVVDTPDLTSTGEENIIPGFNLLISLVILVITIFFQKRKTIS